MRRKAVVTSKSRRSDGWRKLYPALGAILLVVAIYGGYLFYATVRDRVAHSKFSLFSSLPISSVVEAKSETVQQQPQAPQLRERINILLLGIDRRVDENGPCRTDTIIVLSLDPETETVSMLSIPRDLWVYIPDYNVHNRINTAHLLGDVEDYPGGGPALAKKTVQYTLGIPIHYYVRINFEGFKAIVNELGGITINVEAPIHDEKFPDEHYGYMTVDIPAGVQKMDGETALQYARVRHGSSDFHRARRQQQVLVAIKDKALSLDIPVTNIPRLLQAMGDTVETDISLVEMERLAQLARHIRPENIRSAVIDESIARSTITPQGWDVLVADRENIRQLVAEIFPDPTVRVHPTGTPVDLLIEEGAKVEVQNGTVTAGLAENTANYLSKQGYKIVSFSNADRYDYQHTVIIDYTGKSYTLNALIELLGVTPENVRHETVDMGVDIRVILGQDLQVNN